MGSPALIAHLLVTMSLFSITRPYKVQTNHWAYGIPERFRLPHRMEELTDCRSFQLWLPAEMHAVQG